MRNDLQSARGILQANLMQVNKYKVSCEKCYISELSLALVASLDLSILQRQPVIELIVHAARTIQQAKKTFRHGIDKWSPASTICVTTLASNHMFVGRLLHALKPTC